MVLFIHTKKVFNFHQKLRLFSQIVQDRIFGFSLEFFVIRLTYIRANLRLIDHIDYPIYQEFPWLERRHESVDHCLAFHALYFSVNLRPRFQHAAFVSISE